MQKRLLNKFIKLILLSAVFLQQFFVIDFNRLEVSALETNVYISNSTEHTIYSISNDFVDSTISVDLHGMDNVTGAKVMIGDGFTTGDILSYADASNSFLTDPTATYSAANGVLTFDGTYSASQWQAIFRDVKFTPSTTSTTDITSRVITFTLGASLYYNNHFYKAISGGSYSWSDAELAARNSTLFGLRGYLVTITSSGENDFIKAKIGSDSWIGASDWDFDSNNINSIDTDLTNDNNYSENSWRWVTGPEKGILIGVQYNGGSGFASTSSYHNFASGEPNGNLSNESFGEFYSSTDVNRNGTWNDLNVNRSGSNLSSYIIEYGGMDGDPIIAISATKVVDIAANTLTYDANGATSGAAPSIVNYRVSAGTQSITVSNQNTLAKANYTFIGWNTAADGTGTKYDANSTLALSSDITLYAQWLRISSSSPSVSFTIDGSNVHIDPNFILDGTALSSVAISISNYVPGDVLHYSDTSDITGSYNNGTLILSSTSIKSASLFQTAVRTVTLSSTQSLGTRTISYSVVLDTTETTTIKYNPENQHFYQLIDLGSSSTNWMTWTEAKANASTRSYNGKTGYLATLTSLSEDNKIKQIASAFVGSGTSMWMGFKNVESAQTDNGTSYWDGNWQWADGPETGTTFFTGYNLTTNCSTAVGIVVNSQYTRWGFQEPNGCTNTGRGYGTYWMGANYDSNNNGTIDAGESSVGAWDDNSSANSTDSELRYYFIEYGGLSSDSYTTQSSVTILPHTYTLTYDDNGASSGSAPDSASGSVSYTIPSNTGNMVISGYDFNGWNTLSNGTGTSYAAGSSLTPTTDITLYAQWLAISVSNTLTITQTAKAATSSTVSFANLNSNFTSLKYAAVAHGTTSPTIAEIINGQYSSGGLFKASGTVTTSGTISSSTLSNLQDYFYYDLYAVQVDSNLNARNATSTGTVICSSNIRVAYDFNNNLSDATDQQRDLVINSQTSPTSSWGYTSSSTGIVRNAYQFDGTSVFTLPVDIIQYGNNLRNPFTLSFYFKTSATNGVGLFGYNNAATFAASSGFIPMITIATDGKLHAILWKGTGDLHVVSSYAVNDNQWHKVVLSAYQTPTNSATDTLDVYIDGVQVATDSNGTLSHFNMTNVTLGTNYGVLRFDGSTNSYNNSTNITNSWFNPYVGYIDELMVMSGGMSPSQIQEASPDIALEYVLNDGTNPNGTLYLFSKTSTTAYTLPTPTKTNYVFGGWYLNSSFTGSAQTEVAVGTSSNQKYYAKWTIVTKDVTFNSNGGSSIDTLHVNLGSSATAPTPPTKTGYGFVGWYSDSGLNTAYSFANAVNSDITLYAKWSINQYTVSFVSNGGTFVSPQSVSYNSTAMLPSTPTRIGYTFGGWYSDNTLDTAYDFASHITSAKTLYAKWTINSYTVSFISNGGSSVASASVDYLNQVAKPANPTQSQKVFKGWYLNGALSVPYDFENAQVTQNTTLYAKWENIYTFSFDSNYGTYVQGQNVLNGQTASQPSNPSRIGYSFDNWYTSSDLSLVYNFSSNVNTNTTVYAGWTQLNYNLSLDANGGTLTSTSNQSVGYGDLAGTMPSSPTKSNHTFVGWSTSATSMVEWDFSKNRVYGNTTLYAIYTANNYTYIFKDHADTTFSSETIAFGDTIETPERQTLKGYRFIDWQESFDASTQSFTMTPIFEAIDVDINANSMTPVLGNVFDVVEFSNSELENEVSVRFDFNVLEANSVNETDKALFNALAQNVNATNNINNFYLDISLFKTANNDEEEITTTSTPLQISFVVPESFRNHFFNLIRVHDGVAETIEYTYSTLTHIVRFETDQFSTYGLTMDATVVASSSSNTSTIDLPSVTSNILSNPKQPITFNKDESESIEPNSEVVLDDNASIDPDTNGDVDALPANDKKNFLEFFGDIWTSTKETLGIWIEDIQYVVFGINKDDDPTTVAMRVIYLFIALLVAIGSFIAYLFFKKNKNKK